MCYFEQYVWFLLYYFQQEFKRNFRKETENEGVTKINDCAYLFKKRSWSVSVCKLILGEKLFFFFFWEIKLSFCLFKVLERNATIFLKILPWASKAIEVAAAFKLSKSASLFFVVMILASQKNGKYFLGSVWGLFLFRQCQMFFPKIFPSRYCEVG